MKAERVKEPICKWWWGDRHQQWEAAIIVKPKQSSVNAEKNSGIKYRKVANAKTIAIQGRRTRDSHSNFSL
jgi:hypothetical protein